MLTCIVISGGDAPGINAAIDGYARLAAWQGDRVLGAQGGFAGLLDNQTPVEIDPALSSLLAARGGSILQSSRAPALKQPDARERLARVMAGRGIGQSACLRRRRQHSAHQPAARRLGCPLHLLADDHRQ